ncbi:MAG: restriction endonuclease [Nitrosospira sp.]|nr:restriction endonuclease [Nitrosospira sp.]
MTDFGLFILLLALIWLAWKALGKRPAQSKQAALEENPQARHLKSALEFVQAQHRTLRKQQREQNAWQQAYGHANASGLDQLSGEEFEEFLAGLFRTQGYVVELTALTGDYGADLILSKDGQRICVQAKRYAGSVGVAAVQEALSGKAYYQCNAAWVITTGIFTVNAHELAAKSGVRMIGRSAIGNLMAQYAAKTNNS